MFISKIKLKNGVQKSNDFLRLVGNGYFLHQAIWKLFGDGPDRQRDFLYRFESIGKYPLVYAVSRREPDGPLKLWDIEIKKYEPYIVDGMRLGFIVRANPTCKKDGKRHDVVMDLKKKMKSGNGQSEDVRIAEIIQDAGEKWLSSRSGKNGFKVEQVRVDGYRQYKFYKRKNNMVVQYSTLDFIGVLSVINTALFSDMLLNGIGAEKSFGCGLMLVRKT